MTTLSDGVVRARKDHRCGYCETPIPARSSYRRTAVVWDGYLGTIHAHIACDVIARWGWKKFDIDGDERVVHLESLAQPLEDISDAEIAALAFELSGLEIDRLKLLVARFRVEPAKPHDTGLCRCAGCRDVRWAAQEADRPLTRVC